MTPGLTSPPLWEIVVRVAPEAALTVSDALEAFASAVSMFELGGGVEWELRGICERVPDRADLVAATSLAASVVGAPVPDVTVMPLGQRDWVAENRASFPPLHIGRVHVRSSFSDESPPTASLSLVVDAGHAFGSGTHATTSGCLLAMQRLAKRTRPRRVLDMGCGSGILSLTAAKLWPDASVLAVDIDPISAETTRQNARDNRVSRQIRARSGDGYRLPEVKSRGPYDLIVANILARPLCRMAPNLARVLAPGGTAILSGLLGNQEAEVLAAHRAQGLHLERRTRIDEWSVLTIG